MRRIGGMLLLAFGVGCGSTAGGEPTSADAPAVLHAERLFTGEEILRGVLFGTGPVTRLLPEIWESPELKAVQARAKEPAFASAMRAKIDAEFAALPESEPEMDASTVEAARKLTERIQAVPPAERVAPSAATQARLQRTVLRLMRQADPTFFARYGSAMQSGNPVRVDAAMHEATRRVVSAFVELAPQRPKGADCGACGGSCGGTCGGQACSGNGGTSCSGNSGASCSGNSGSSCSGNSGSSCSGQSSCGGSQNWFYAVNYVAISNVVAGVSAVAAGVVAVVILGFFWDPTSFMWDGPTHDESGLAPDHKLQRQMIINVLSNRLSA